MVDPAFSTKEEQAFALVCDAAGIVWERPEQMGGRLDFYLPALRLYVEVKAFSCERLHEQLQSVESERKGVMVLIGMPAIAALEQLLYLKVERHR